MYDHITMSDTYPLTLCGLDTRKENLNFWYGLVTIGAACKCKVCLEKHEQEKRKMGIQ